MTAIGVQHNRSLHAGHRVCSEVHLETTSGLLVGRTSTWSTVLWTSAQSATQALVLDAAGDVLLAGPLGTYDVGRLPPRHHERTDVWAWQIPCEIADRACEIAVIHSWNSRWLATLAPDVPSLDALTALAAASRMGDVATGREMDWPEDEMPWARWPKGLVRPADDPRRPSVLELPHEAALVGGPDR